MRLSVLFGLSGTVLCTALLTACGGGSGATSGGSTIPSHVSAPGGPTTPKGTGVRVTVRIDRAAHKKHFQSKSRLLANGKRAPKFIDPWAAEGLQIAVSSAGLPTQTIYADISDTSPLCTSTGGYPGIVTCTLTIPALAATEQIVGTEVDETPSGENTTTGYGTSFPDGSDILGAGTTTATLIPGTVTAVTLGLGMVVAELGDCTECVPLGTTQSGPNFQPDFAFYPPRIVVTAGVASTGVIQVVPLDEDDDCFNPDTTPVQYADVNANPVPITLTSNTSNITFAPIVNGGTPPPAGPLAATASIPDDSYVWACFDLPVTVNIGASISAASVPSIVVNNNLTAISPFTLESYPATMTYTVAPVSVSPLTAAVAVTGTVTAQVLGADNQASNGMGAESAINADDGNCNIGATTYATVASNSAIGPDWTQGFTITPTLATPAGTPCTFVLYDEDTGVPSQTVSVTVGS